MEADSQILQNVVVVITPTLKQNVTFRNLDKVQQHVVVEDSLIILKMNVDAVVSHL